MHVHRPAPGPALHRSLVGILVFLAVRAAASITLTTSGPDWDYTLKDLASTTSQACKDAYAAPIDCDYTLLGIAASMRPAFKPGPSDLAAMCVSTCAQSLVSWVEGVQTACSADGDLANVAVNSTTELPKARVEAVGQVLQYEYGFACSQNATSWCYLSLPASSDWARSDFPCSDACAIAFYRNTYLWSSGAAYRFLGYSLVEQNQGWLDTYAGGWQTARQCLLDGAGAGTGDDGGEATSVALGGSPSFTAPIRATPARGSLTFSSFALSSPPTTGSAASEPSTTQPTTTTPGKTLTGTPTSLSSSTSSLVSAQSSSGARRRVEVPMAALWRF